MYVYIFVAFLKIAHNLFSSVVFLQVGMCYPSPLSSLMGNKWADFLASFSYYFIFTCLEISLKKLFLFSRFQLKDLPLQNQFTDLQGNLYRTLALVDHLMKVMHKLMEQYQKVHYKLYNLEYGN